MNETEQESLLSIADVAKIIAKSDTTHNFSILEYSLHCIEEKIGLCCDHAILKVSLKPQHESHVSEKRKFFVKLYPKTELSANFAEGTGAFRKEHFVYTLFDKLRDENVTLLDKCVPQCYFKEMNKLLVLENLTEQHFSSLNKQEYLDYETVKVVLEALAKLHCSTLIYEEKISEEKGETFRLIHDYENELEETYFSDREDFQNAPGLGASLLGLVKSIEIFGFSEELLSGKDFATVLKEVFRKVFKLAKPSRKHRNVLCHGDLWATNILINEENPKKCKFVDFQCGRYTPPAQDVLAFLYLTTSRQFRKENMYNLIGFYYSNLEKIMSVHGFKLERILPFGDFLNSCEEQKIFAIIQAANYFPLILLKNETIVHYLENNELSQKALNEDRSILVREHIDQDEKYKLRIEESMQDLKDYCDYL